MARSPTRRPVLINHEFHVDCDWCQQPSGDTGTPVPAPFPTAAAAIADALAQEWSHDLATGRLLCPECADLAERLAPDNPTSPPPTGLGWWVHLDFVTDDVGGAFFARRGCGRCHAEGLVAVPEWLHRHGRDTDTCACVRRVPQATVTRPALLTDGQGHVVRALVLAPADIESWPTDRPLLVAEPGHTPAIATLAGRLAFYGPQIGRHPAESLSKRDQPHCAFCDVGLRRDQHSLDYPLYDGPEPDGQICPAHPYRDRPRPHLAKWPKR